MGSLEDSPLASDFFHQTDFIITQNLYLSEKNKTMIFTNDITSKLANKVSRINKKPKWKRFVDFQSRPAAPDRTKRFHLLLQLAQAHTMHLQVTYKVISKSFNFNTFFVSPFLASQTMHPALSE
jgi:hypothetical protein